MKKETTMSDGTNVLTEEELLAKVGRLKRALKAVVSTVKKILFGALPASVCRARAHLARFPRCAFPATTGDSSIVRYPI